MEEGIREVLFETCYHASKPYSSNYPPSHQQPNEGIKGSLLSLLSTRGVKHFKEKWSAYGRPQKFGKWISLFVSPRGEYVAVAVGNQITILQKNDDYREPCGLFTSGSLGIFTSGMWSEVHDILGVVDDSDTLYLIKSNGEEITGITKSHFRISLPIIGLVVQDDSEMKKPALCTFIVLTSDGSLHDIDIGQHPNSSVSSPCTSNSSSRIKGHFPPNVVCLDYHAKVSLLAVVSSASSNLLTSNNGNDSCSLSLWQRTGNLDLELVTSSHFEGLYYKPKGYVGQLTSPKVLISLQGKYVASLDLRGCLVTFKLDKEECALSSFHFGGVHDSKMTNDVSTRGTQYLNDIVDFAWWSDHILAVAKRNGAIAMIDILTGDKLLKNDPLYSMPILERAQSLPGRLFVLESMWSEGSDELSEKKEAGDFHPLMYGTVDSYNHFDFAKMKWKLISFAERSVPEMYDIMISGSKYQAALDFAENHGLNKDEVFKSQWLNSCQGVAEINTLLSSIMDKVFVLSECVDRVGLTEDSMRALLAYGLHLTDHYRFSESEGGSQIWEFRLARLKLLQFRDRLETFIGINMGRYSVQEYSRFRTMPINQAATVLAESGKIGALNLLFKRHPYSLSPFILEVLAAIPETVPVQTYGQLLPGSSPPSSIALREEDWVECVQMVNFINSVPESHDTSVCLIRTELIVKQCFGFSWPSTDELSAWYRNRARDIDTCSGQLENCQCLVDFACRRGICELQQFHEDISYLNRLIYTHSGEDETNFTMSLVSWEQLSDYEKFKMMLKGVKEDNVIKRLHDDAIPFMSNRLHVVAPISGDEARDSHSSLDNKDGSFLVRWLKETASENKLDICLTVFEEGSREYQSNVFFRDEAEAVDCALQCVYACSVIDRWSTLASILSKLPPLRDYEVESLKKRLKQTEGHVEAGRLLAFYQVPKPISFFLEAHSDGRGVKQILRLILSKFIRRQPGRLDNDWANMWRDLQSLQEKAFPFLDLEYMLMEFCRGLLKAGKFSLARNYLRGTGSVALDTYKAENLVIQAAREYFFSASSLTCSDIWKAKECLNIFPNSRNVCAEADIIDAVTVKLPELGVNLLPVQFRQIKDPMEVIKLAITNRTGAYLNVDELIEIAKLLGLNSQDEISAVQEAIAREAAVAGDLQLAFDLCLVLAKKGHGPVWDLCAALARGPALEHMDIGSRKQLIGFALGHCDEESIGELLLAWKDLDMQGQCETLMTLTGTNPSSFSIHGSSTNSYSPHRTEDADELRDWSELIDRRDSQDQEYLNNIKEVLCLVIKNFQVDNGLNWESVFRENGKLWSFATLWLPWLLELSRKFENGKKIISDTVLDEHYTSIRTQAVETILSWLACNGFVPMDNLIASLAKSIMESPISEKEDIIGCSFLLNLADAFHGVEFIEEKARTREKYNEICSIMNVGMIYSLLHNSGVECVGPAQRRELMLSIFHQKHTSLVSDERDTIDEAQSSFWREWKLKLEEQKRVADHSRVLEQVIPGVETARFLSGDIDYMESVIFSLIETVKLEKKQILKDLLKLASTYDLNRTKVLLHYIRSVLVSEVWTNNDIMAEVSECKGEIHSCSADVIKIISFSVYPEINGCDKQRLAFIYGLLSDCYLQLEDSEELLRLINPDPAHSSTQGLAHFYKIIEHECFRVSFIKTLNFKNIAGLGGLNFNCFIDEVYAHIDEDSVESLAKMVHTLVELYGNSVPESLLSWQQIYKHHVLGLLTALETRAKTETYFQSAENLHLFIGELETTYELCMRYFKFMRYSEVLDIMKWFFRAILPIEDCLISVSCDSTWQDNLVLLLNFWLRLADDLQEFESHDHLEEKFSPDCLAKCLKFFLRLIIDGKISQNQGWGTVLGYAKYGFSGGNAIEILVFCKSMIFSGCEFEAVVNVFSEVNFDSIPDLSHLYLTILEAIFEEFPTESLQHHNLHHLLSSLSKIDGNLEDLNKVRHTIWAKMVEFSNNLQLPNKVRVYVLELMQSISSTGRNMRQLSSERIPDVLPWEGWNNFQTTTEELKNVSDSGDAPTIFTNTLVALRSSGLISAISPILQVTSKDLLTVGSAVSCFVRLSEASTSKTHVDILISVLKEWEELFTIGKESKDEPIFTKESDGDNNWGNDDWDEGWENFQEEEIVENDIKNGDSTLSVHPLHACWLEILKKLVNLSEFRDGFKLIDQYLSKPTKILLDQDGACSLIQILLEKDRFTALKMALLFPYEELQIRCLDAVEDRLKQESAPETIDQEHELLILVLSSRITSIIVTKPCYGTIFSYICYIVGNLSRRCQEAKLSIKNKRSGCCDEKNVSFIFGCVMFPCFVSELVKAEQHILAGFLVTKFMHTNPSLSLMNVAESNLRHYFERQIRVLKCDDFACGETGFLVNTISSLRGRLGDLIQSALSLLPSNVR